VNTKQKIDIGQAAGGGKQHRPTEQIVFGLGPKRCAPRDERADGVTGKRMTDRAGHEVRRYQTIPRTARGTRYIRDDA
jgi:hypothetical protein